MIVPLDDPSDPRLAPYLAVRERDLVGRQGLFVAEGEVVLRVLIERSRFQADSVLVAGSRLDASGELLARLRAEVPVYAVPQAVMDEVTGFHIHRGLLAIGRRGAEPSRHELLAGLPRRALVVVLVGLANHDNVGGVFRSAAAFGADAVLLDATSCDPLYRKAIRVSVGGALITPFARAGTAGEILDDLAAGGFEALSLSPGGRETVSSVSRPERAALVLGTEGRGLPPEVLARTRTVRIPMSGGFDSLNVATAGAIALHRWADARDEAAETG